VCGGGKMPDSTGSCRNHSVLRQCHYQDQGRPLGTYIDIRRCIGMDSTQQSGVIVSQQVGLWVSLRLEAFSRHLRCDIVRKHRQRNAMVGWKRGSLSAFNNPTTSEDEDEDEYYYVSVLPSSSLLYSYNLQSRPRITNPSTITTTK
jgi:hypothetical protein